MNTIKILFKGIEFEAEFCYQPYERQTLEHQGCPESIEDITLTYKDEDFSEFVEVYYDKLAEIIIKTLQEY